MAARQPESCKVHPDREESHICVVCWQAQCSKCMVALVNEKTSAADGHIHTIKEIDEAIPLADTELEKTCKLISDSLRVKKDSKLSKVLSDMETARDSDYRYRLSAMRGILKYQKKYGSFAPSSRSSITQSKAQRKNASTSQHLSYKDQPRTRATPPISNAGVQTHQGSSAHASQHLCYKDKPRTQATPPIFNAGVPTHQESSAHASQHLFYKDQPRTQATPPILNVGVPTHQESSAPSSQNLCYKDRPRTQAMPPTFNVVAPTAAAWSSVGMSAGGGDRGVSTSNHYRRVAEVSSRVQRGSLAPTAAAWTALGMSAGQGDTTASSRKRPAEDANKSSKKRRA